MDTFTKILLVCVVAFMAAACAYLVKIPAQLWLGLPATIVYSFGAFLILAVVTLFAALRIINKGQ